MWAHSMCIGHCVIYSCHQAGDLHPASQFVLWLMAPGRLLWGGRVLSQVELELGLCASRRRRLPGQLESSDPLVLRAAGAEAGWEGKGCDCVMMRRSVLNRPSWLPECVVMRPCVLIRLFGQGSIRTSQTEVGHASPWLRTCRGVLPRAAVVVDVCAVALLALTLFFSRGGRVGGSLFRGLCSACGFLRCGHCRWLGHAGWVGGAA